MAIHELRFRTICGMWSPALTATRADVARRLGVTDDELNWLAEERGPFNPSGVSANYVVKYLPKSRGGTRLLMAPKPKLKAAQTTILRELLDGLAPHPAAHGFCKRHSIVTHAKQHVGKRVVVTCDLREFFPSINFPRVCGLLIALGFSESVARVLAFICTTRQPGSRRRVLPQGAPTSPAFSNLIAYGLDVRLSALAGRLGFTYTRYADDCTFSGDRALIGALLKRVRAIAIDEGFRLNETKTRTRRQGACQRVTGIVVNDHLAVSRAERRRLRAILHQAKKTGLEPQNRAGVEHFAAHLRGRIAFVAQVNPRHAEPLRRDLDAVSPRR